MLRLIPLLLLAAVLGGCSALTTTPTSNEQLAIDSAGDAGALGCAVLASKLDPADTEKARRAADAASTLLRDPEPNIAQLQLILAEGIHGENAIFVAVLIQRLKVRLDSAGVLPPDSVALRMADSFVSACRLALG